MPTSFPAAVDSFTALDHSLTDAVVALETKARQNTDNILYDSLTHDLWLTGTTFNDPSDDTYTATLWNLVWATNAPDITGQAGGASDPLARYLRCTHDANSQAGIVQFIESKDTIPLRGKTVSLSADLWGTSVGTLRMAVLEWTSTADSVTSDVVGTWGAGNPTLAANWAYLGTPAAISISTTRLRYAVNGLSVGASANNLAVFIWTDAVEASGDLWNVARTKLEVSTGATDFVAKSYKDELESIHRFYQKTFPTETAPAQATGSTAGSIVTKGVVATANTLYASWYFEKYMRATPTVTTYSPHTADANWRNGANTASLTTTILGQGPNGVYFSSSDAPVVQTSYFLHATADARM